MTRPIHTRLSALRPLSKARGLTLVFLLCLFASCSTTRVIPEGEYRMVKNKVIFDNAPQDVRGSDVTPYIAQKSQGWSPMLVIYNWAKSDRGFLRKVVRSLGKAPTVFNPSLVETSTENIDRHLEYLGYYGSHVSADVKKKRRKAYVDYHIRLGHRFTIGDIAYVLPDRGEIASDFTSDLSNTSIHPGDYLSEKALETESLRSTQTLRNMGYYTLTQNHYSFEADTLRVPGTAFLEMKIGEYTRNETEDNAKPLEKYTFGDISIAHPASLHIRSKVLRNMNTIKPGELYNSDVINNTYSRLTALRLFSGVGVSTEQSTTDSTKIDCKINLTPSRRQGFQFKIEASTNSSALLGISPELSYYHKNIFKGAEQLTLGLMGNFQFKPNSSVHSTEFGISGGLSFPKFLLLPDRLFRKTVPRTEINASLNYQNRPEYQRSIISTSYGYNGVHKKLYYQFFPLQLNIVHLFGVDQDFYDSIANNPFMRNAYVSHFDLGMGGTLYLTTNPSANPTNSYHYIRFTTSLAGNVLSLFNSAMEKDENGARRLWNTPYSQYVRGELTLGWTQRFGREEQFALASRFVAGAGYAYGNSSALPFEQHFYVGGSNSLRGWQARSVGPGFAKKETTFVIPNQSGDMRLEANLELRYPLFGKFSGATFLDTGNVWTYLDKDKNDEAEYLGQFHIKDFYKTLALNTGFGLRLDLNFILIRLDWGFVLHDPARDSGERWRAPDDWFGNNGYAIHFGVGYPF